MFWVLSPFFVVGSWRFLFKWWSYPSHWGDQRFEQLIFRYVLSRNAIEDVSYLCGNQETSLWSFTYQPSLAFGFPTNVQPKREVIQRWSRGSSSLTVSFDFPFYETDPFPRSPALSRDMSSPVWLELQRSTLRTLCLTQVVAPLQSTMPTPTGLNLGRRCQWTKSCNRKNMSMMCAYIYFVM